MTIEELGLVGGVVDDRCCGDHPRDWSRLARPGYSFCSECLERLGDASLGRPAQ